MQISLFGLAFNVASLIINHHLLFNGRIGLRLSVCVLICHAKAGNFR